jgi:predicted ATP-dependent Lon-type protease
MGTEMGMLGGYGFQGQVTAGDGSDKQGKIGAGYTNLRRKKKTQ